VVIADEGYARGIALVDSRHSFSFGPVMSSLLAFALGRSRRARLSLPRLVCEVVGS
jgi:hypothetical protein